MKISSPSQNLTSFCPHLPSCPIPSLFSGPLPSLSPLLTIRWGIPLHKLPWTGHWPMQSPLDTVSKKCGWMDDRVNDSAQDSRPKHCSVHPDPCWSQAHLVEAIVHYPQVYKYEVRNSNRWGILFARWDPWVTDWHCCHTIGIHAKSQHSLKLIRSTLSVLRLYRDKAYLCWCI